MEEVVEVVYLAVYLEEARKRLDTTIILNQVIQNNNTNQRQIQGESDFISPNMLDTFSNM